jgi:glycerol-1-phosphate dehydrogenase [NAD(P)+]
MPDRTITVPRLLHVGRDCLGDLPPLLERHGFDLTRVRVGTGSGPSLTVGRSLVDDLRAAGLDVVLVKGLTGRLDQAATTAAAVIDDGTTLLVGVGGGRVIDTLKLASVKSGVDFLSVPTTIAHDGISSPVASLTAGDARRHSFAAAMPAGVIVDIGLIGSAPLRTLRAGAGDLLSNLTANLDWRLAERAHRDHYDAFSAMIAEGAAKPALDLTDLTDEANHELLARGLVLSGLAMAAAGTSRPCSGAEHLISHSLDELLDDDTSLHGEQVALGTLIAAMAHRSPLLPRLRAVYRRLGLPLHPEALGITEQTLITAVRHAPATRPDRYTVLSELAGDPGALDALVRTTVRFAAGEDYDDLAPTG